MESKELIEKYNLITNNYDKFLFFVESKNIPTEQDYNNGFVTRYFFKKINEKKYTEINFKSYNNSKENKFLVFIKIEWKISGIKNNLYKNKILEIEGVEEYNLKVIKDNKLENILTNPLEYWKGK